MSNAQPRFGSCCTSMLYTRDLERSRTFYDRWLPAWSFDTATDDPRHITIRMGDQAVAHARVVEGDGDEWVPMVRVADLEASLVTATTIGATIVDRDDIAGVARIARLRDLEGATFGLWQPSPDLGVAVTDVVGSLWWIEVLTRDPARAVQFYSRLFGWQARTTAFAPFDSYVVLERSGHQEGGVLPIDPDWDVPPRWNTIVAVADADAAWREAASLGGCAHFAHTVPSAGRIAGVSDPGGAILIVRGPVPQP
ncbi:hydroxylase [Luteitalea sp. TBR-22]|uniref:VOC family protein n=1 Tax=Luteitalea sp. TBR-22 TaxID=2802971 RepID=UPI001AFBA8FF|nr:VOC family protein [Luteitalea sp. TBR-22]BCS32985.1 hydroxylase [Luteitalea sp. TBR-22]